MSSPSAEEAGRAGLAGLAARLGRRGGVVGGNGRHVAVHVGDGVRQGRGPDGRNVEVDGAVAVDEGGLADREVADPVGIEDPGVLESGGAFDAESATDDLLPGLDNHLGAGQLAQLLRAG